MNFANILVQNIQSIVTNYKIRNARQKAICNALMSIGNVYPEYKGIGFDEHFMTNSASELMQPFLVGGSLPTANALLTAWASQFPYSTESAQKAIVNLTPLVTDFLYVLGSEEPTVLVSEQAAPIRIKPVYVTATA